MVMTWGKLSLAATRAGCHVPPDVKAKNKNCGKSKFNNFKNSVNNGFIITY